MRRRWWIVPLLGVVLLAGYVVAGPYLAMRGISQAIADRDAAQLDSYVDFPSLRVNLKAQLDDYLIRQAGSSMQSSLLGGFALQLASGISGAGVDTLVTPLGIGALLQGHSVWNRLIGDTVSADTYAAPAPARPLQGATQRFESTRRFTATTQTADGAPVNFVLTRQGLRWRLTDIQLPLPATPSEQTP
ncbi:hypothetical protein BJD12_21350 [Xanthomonas vesicatoria ATCC 35937]|uniref:Uncharacterized protein n=1 Tax=Xanthomonas vesicatoria ATCC 35937 TaxID=925775 RepID=F0BIZ9_9XANT|nr:DUF2939 domain-containing protein [Xanthomonas vesicatoria]APP77345.1 hypothetical protein BJD12_21350 [Xanthomonas vesicatoria ATCC 35937]EGD07536.1 hypothetical protein XVE_4257 [Xanthomonas vesicatoria ATCC 35937]KTF34679.1 hypothetical protein LMG920_05290 [Xanthomonas vesicatoria]MCC8598823.1 DUF2939 domain-containing protein [Xanthomonas vesicatoria]MCC8606520.1 DUF2939 domain-containing protein [Xanthomonas vesicatoria]